MLNTRRISKMSTMAKLSLKPKRTLRQKVNLINSLTEEEREDYQLARSLKLKYNENGN